MKAKKPLIGIVGGTGKMGRLMEEFFKESGHQVLISSKKTPLTNIALAKQCDVVIVAVPLAVTKKVIKDIAPYIQKGALFTDVTAVKEDPVTMMLESQASVVGMHPVFGPMAKTFKGKTVVLCPARGEKWFLWLKKILEESGAQVTVCAPLEHDQMMAVIQGLIHFVSISIGYFLKSHGLNIEKSMDFASPNYKIQMSVVGRILSQKPEVFSDISLHNRFITETIQDFHKNSKELYEAILEKDKDVFEKIFKESSDFVKDYHSQAVRETNYLIEKTADEREKEKIYQQGSTKIV